MAVFFRDYFSQYPKRLMLRLKEGDTVQLERFQDVIEARVVKVDCSLVNVCRLDICMGMEGLYICTCWPAYCMWMWYIKLLFASACSCISKLKEVQLRKQFTNGCIEGVFAWHLCFWKKLEEWLVVPLIAVLLTSAAWLCSMLFLYRPLLMPFIPSLMTCLTTSVLQPLPLQTTLASTHGARLQ